MNSIRKHLEEQILRVLPAAVSVLSELSRKTFYETFIAGNDVQNMRLYLRKVFSEHRLPEELAQERSEFYFVKLQGNPEGYIKLNKDNCSGPEVERIYIRSCAHGKGIGEDLM